MQIVVAETAALMIEDVRIAVGNQNETAGEQLRRCPAGGDPIFEDRPLVVEIDMSNAEKNDYENVIFERPDIMVDRRRTSPGCGHGIIQRLRVKR
jgi:hypothetical protein